MRKQDSRSKRARRIRKRVSGTKDRPRLSVFRSNLYLYAQLIDDESHVTLLSCNSKLKAGKEKKSKTDMAAILGKEFGKTLKKKGVKKIVFDRSGYKYHGRIKAFADSIRKEGIDF